MKVSCRPTPILAYPSAVVIVYINIEEDISETRTGDFAKEFPEKDLASMSDYHNEQHVLSKEK